VQEEEKGSESAIFIPATPCRQLRKRFMIAIAEAKVRIGVAETLALV